jgi:hypothetical protein
LTGELRPELAGKDAFDGERRLRGCLRGGGTSRDEEHDDAKPSGAPEGSKTKGQHGRKRAECICKYI